MGFGSLLVVILTLVSAPHSAISPSEGNAPDLSATKKQVLDLEREWVDAELKHDETTLRRIIDDKFLVSFGPNKPQDKETFIKHLMSGDVDPTETQVLTDQTVIVDNDTAVVVGTDTLHGTRKGVAYILVARYTATYIHRKEQWVALAEHLVQVPQAK